MQLLFLCFTLLISNLSFAKQNEDHNSQNISRAKAKRSRKVVDREMKFLEFYFQVVKGPEIIKNLTNKYVSKDESKTSKKFMTDLNTFGNHFPMPTFEYEDKLVTLKLQGKELKMDFTMASSGYIEFKGRRIQFNGNMDEFYNEISNIYLKPKTSSLDVSKFLIPQAHAIIPAALAVKFLVSMAAAAAAYYVCKERNCKSPILAAVFSTLYLIFAGVDHMVEINNNESLGEYLQRVMGIQKFRCPQENHGVMELVVKDDETGKLRSYALNMTNSSSAGIEWNQPYSFEIVENGKKLGRNLVDQAEHLIKGTEVRLSGDQNEKESWELKEVAFNAMKSTVEFLCNKDPDIWGSIKNTFKAAKGAINLNLDKASSSAD